MMFHKHLGLGISAIFLLCTISLTAQTPTWKPGDTLVYEIVSESHISGGHLPPQAYAPRPAAHRSIRIAITGVEADGTALAHVKIDTPDLGGIHMPGIGMAAAARKGIEDQYRYQEFDARLTRDGALMVAVDNAPADNETPNAKPMSQAELAHYRDAIVAEVNSPAYQANLAKNDAVGTFQIPNVVALSCAKRTSLAAGDTWHIVSKSVRMEYDVAVVGNQSYRSRNTIVLNVKENMPENPNGSVDTTATVYYDPQSRLVVGMHVVAVNNIKVTGITSTSTSDLNLK